MLTVNVVKKPGVCVGVCDCFLQWFDCCGTKKPALKDRHAEHFCDVFGGVPEMRQEIFSKVAMLSHEKQHPIFLHVVPL